MLKHPRLPFLLLMFSTFISFSSIDESDSTNTIGYVSKKSENDIDKCVLKVSDWLTISSIAFEAFESTRNTNTTIVPFRTKEIDLKEIDNLNGNKQELETIQNEPDNSTKETSIIDDVILKVKRIIYSVIKILLALAVGIMFYFGFNYVRKRNLKIRRIEHEIFELKNQITLKNNEINRLNHLINSATKNTAQVERYKTEAEIRILKSKVIDNLVVENKLSNEEISFLTKECENRWIVLGHSAQGNAHIKASPSIPCQDSHHFEIMENGWVLSIVCDGAGSAKHSNLGSDYLAKSALPLNLKLLLSKSSWYKNRIVPEEEEWSQISQQLFAKSLEELRDWVLNSNYHQESLKEFATTVILSLHNNNGILIANIGDGRGGYLNKQGDLKPLFVPFRGDESNSTVFITSEIWGKPYDYIKTKVINEIPLSVFLLSDGLEKISFNCSQMIDGVWMDPNIPFRNFFYPIFRIIKEIPKGFESRLNNDWKNLLENGNDRIKNESDDKTMVLSFLK